MIEDDVKFSPHQERVQQWLNREPNDSGLTVRVVNMPPRSGKTMIAQRRLAGAKPQKLHTYYGGYTEMQAHSSGYDATVRGAAGSMLAGHRFDLAVLDDMLGGGYYPAAQLNVMKEQLTLHIGSLLNHMAPKGTLIVLESRFSKYDDTTAIVLDKLGPLVEQLVIPAIENGASFWPENWSVKELQETGLAVTPAMWRGLYMQNPGP